MTEKDKKKLKEYGVKGGIVLVFLSVLFYAFSSEEDKKDAAANTGLNTELPDGKAEPLNGKMKAYENLDGDAAKDRQMKSLNDYMFALKSDDAVPSDDLEKKYDIEIKNVSNQEMNHLPGMDVLKTSITRGQGDAISESEYHNMAVEKAGLETQVYKLEQELEKERRAKNPENQLALMEKSYEIAQKYMGGGGSASGANITQGTTANSSTEFPAEEQLDVYRKGNDVVSTLSEPLELNAPYNFDFNTAVGADSQIITNTIRAAINGDQTVTANQRVQLRLLEPLQVGSITIPRNYLLSGMTRVEGDRLNISIQSIEYAGNIIPVQLKVYDTDGMPGLYCPGSLELDALKEGAANIGSGLGSSISFAQSAGQQIVMDVTRGVMNGASQYMSKKLRTVQITLKSNYEVLLLPQKR